jgi:flagellar basal body P-ring formation protein FlgA
VIVLLLAMLTIFSAPTDITIDTDTISLGALIPFPASDARAAISLGYAPKPGLARRITRSEILSKLSAAGKPVDDIQLPESILVHRLSAGLDHDRVMKAILDEFIKRFPGGDINITNIQVPPVQIGTGPVEISASLPARFDPSTPVFVRVDLRGSSFAKTVFVRTSVHIETDQPVLKNKVAAHSEIQPDDIEWKKTPLRSVTSKTAADSVDGMVLKRDLESGQILTNELLYTPITVRKGETVTVRAVAGSVTVAATMRARAAGKVGDTIPVEHLTGQGTTMARIVGPRTLEVSK